MNFTSLHFSNIRVITKVYISFFFLIGSSVSAWAEDIERINENKRYELCGEFTRIPTVNVKSERSKATKKILIQAEQAQVNQQAISLFSGNVEAYNNGNSLKADQLQYDNNKDYFNASGNIFFTNDSIEVYGDKFDYNIQTQSGEIRNAKYYLFDNGARGTAPSIQVVSKNHLKFIETTYTTCPENNSAWKINASIIKLNSINHQGTAENAVLSFYNVPILYFPYFRFPFGTDRLSGFLVPSWGTSKINGDEYRLPFYWNIASNMDATIIPRHMTKRGTLIDNEFRYLTENSNGKVEVGFIQNDAIFNDDRQFYSFMNNYNHSNGWNSIVDLKYYSDPNYLLDFSAILEEASISHIEQRAELLYRKENWLFLTKLQGYQTLSGDDPYTRLPQFILNYNKVPLDNQFNYFYNSELVYFAHESTKPRINRDTTPTGVRADFLPAINYPLVNSAAYLKPKVSLRYTQYSLDNPGSSTEVNSTTEYSEQPSRTVPTLSLDSGIFLERDTALFDIPILHTLEPRIFYLYRPEVDQTQLPNFDTTTVDRSYTQLFREDTTTGADLVFEANELTVGISSHFYRLDTGVSMLSASLGQKYLFELSTNPATSSNYFVEVTSNPTSYLNLGSTLEYNEKTGDLNTSTSRLQYKTERDGVLNFLHRYEREQTESLDISSQWRITTKWQIFGRRNYDKFNQKVVEEVYGFRYDNCCWAFRIMDRRTVLKNERTLFFELILKGLSSIGDQKYIEPLINNAIIDYSN